MTRGKDNRGKVILGLYDAAAAARTTAIAIRAARSKHYPDPRLADIPQPAGDLATQSLITLGTIEKALLSEASALAQEMTGTQLGALVNDRLVVAAKLNPFWARKPSPPNGWLTKPALAFRLYCVCMAIRLEENRASQAAPDDIDDHILETFRGAYGR
jgi:hypothetical protein